MAYRQRKRKKPYRRRTTYRRKQSQPTSEMELLVLGVLGLVALVAALQGSTFLSGEVADFDLMPALWPILRVVLWLIVGLCVVLALMGLWRYRRARILRKAERQAQINTFEAVRARNTYGLIDWRQLEEYVGYVYERQGYDVMVTPGSKDGGLDAILKKDGQVTVVQVKHYSSNVGRPAVQQFVGAMQGYDAGIFITTSDYTVDARTYADTIANLRLCTGAELKAMHDALD